MTVGQMMVYGGIGLIVLSGLAMLLCIPLFNAQRKKYVRKILKEYE